MRAYADELQIARNATLPELINALGVASIKYADNAVAARLHELQMRLATLEGHLLKRTKAGDEDARFVLTMLDTDILLRADR